MSVQEDQFLKSLRATFKVEASEHVESIAEGLSALEKTVTADERRRWIETVFRAAHSLKGAARAVNFAVIESACQTIEDVFAAWKRREITPSTPVCHMVQQLLDAVSKTLDDPEGKPDPGLSLHVDALKKATISSPPANRTEPPSGERSQKETPAAPRPIEADKTAIAETVRISVAKLDARLLEAEEMLSAKLLTSQRETELRELRGRLHEWKKRWARIQPLVRDLRQSAQRSSATNAHASHPALPQIVEFLDWNLDYFESLESRVASLTRTAKQDSLLVAKLVDDLLDDSKKLLMLPASTISAFLRRLVRDLCRDQGKQAELVTIGEEVEMDKRVLEAMKDPLIHIIRNCVDHGLETPQQRQQQGKAASATITLSITPLNEDTIQLIVADDGAGIDIEKVKSSAVRQGVITSAEANRVTDTEALSLIFRADVSTSPMITELSGRGLGLAIVREQTEKLGGTVSVESSSGSGTTIRMNLPVTLRTFRGILVKTANQLFVIPTAQVQRVTRFRREEIKTVEGREVLTLNGRAIALAHLSSVLELGLDRNEDLTEIMPLIVLGTSDEQIAFAVDAIINEHELLLKKFAKPLLRVRNIAGATVLGSGHVAPVLNVVDLLKSANKNAGLSIASKATEKAAEETKSILLVEDSITSRMLLKGILESAGYYVKTAVDGMDAFTVLRTQAFDLVVSDVEMPRLNGFDLTARIRADRKLGNLPVVLVTALETREDRERGIDVGASAYLVKSNFDQSNLLETVRRLA